MNSRTADSKPARSTTHQGKKRPAMLSLEEPTKTKDTVPLLAPLPPVHRGAQIMPYPMSPMTPGLGINDSPGSLRSSSTSSTFTFDLLSPTTPHHDRAFSFTACPTSPLLDESVLYEFPPDECPTSANSQMGSWKLSADHSDLPIIFGSPLLSEDSLEEVQSPHDDRKYFHVQFLQEDTPFPKTPDC